MDRIRRARCLWLCILIGLAGCTMPRFPKAARPGASSPSSAQVTPTPVAIVEATPALAATLQPTPVRPAPTRTVEPAATATIDRTTTFEAVMTPTLEATLTIDPTAETTLAPAVTPAPEPTPASVSTSSQGTESAQRAKGRQVFLAKCAHCHGESGQGGVGPKLVRTPQPLGGYKTAAGLFEYLSRAMPYDAPRTLKAEEYWALVAFLLEANRLLPDKSVTIGPDNAESVRLDVYP